MITPTRDYLLIEREPMKAVTSGGIILPDIAQNPAMTGTVDKIGPSGSKHVTQGDRVLFTKYVAHKINDKQVIARDGDVIGVLADNLLTVFGDIVIAEPIQAEQGIIIQLNTQTTRAKVLYKGDEADEVDVGDTILFYSNIGESFTWNDKTYLAFRQKDIRAVLTSNT